MAFDEKGQAAEMQDKVDICKRAYDILVDEVGMDASDIILIRTFSLLPQA